MRTGLWANRNYVFLFASQIVSLLGSGVTTVALAIFAYQLTGGESATAIIGNALFLRILAFLLFSQFAGVLADRVNRKKILIVSDVVRFGLLALFPFITEVWQIYALIFAINAVTAFFTPTFEASLPEVVGEVDYVKALSFSRVAVDIEAFAAPALAGLLVAAFSVKWVFWFDACTYLVSAALVLMVTIPQSKTNIDPIRLRGLMSDLTLGTRILLREPSLRQALLLSFAEATAGAAAIVATVVYVNDVLRGGDTSFAIVMAILGLGSSIAAMILGRTTTRLELGARDKKALHYRRHDWSRSTLFVGGIMLSLILLPGIFQPPLLIFAALWFINGAGQALISIASGTLLAEHTRAEERGRAYAAYFALTHACWLITYPAIGYAAVWWKTPLTFTLAGVSCIFIVLFAFLTGGPKQLVHEHQT
jgi:MFS transporter, NRE family, putaive nickel resistance protein